MSQENNTSTQPGNLREITEHSREIAMPTLTLDECFDEDKHEMKNKEHVDNMKNIQNVRLFALNMHGYRPEQADRIKELRTSAEKYQTNMSLFNEASTKWNTINIGRVEREMKRLGRGTKILTLDSKK